MSKKDETMQENTPNVDEPKVDEPKVDAPKTVTIKLPLTRESKDDVYVGLNGVGFLIKRGVPVEVPAGVAEILRHQEEMLNIAMEFEEAAAAPLETMNKT